MTEKRIERLDSELFRLYEIVKENVLNNGFQDEIEWCNTIPPLNDLDKWYFFREFSWVVINSGMNNIIAKKIFDKFWNNKDFKFEEVRHPNKRKSLLQVYKRLDFYFTHLKSSQNRIMYLESLPHIGKITKYHLARNLGLNYAKPDRHLVRIASLLGFNNVQSFCEKISYLSNDKIGVVDLIFWRYATLNNDYPEIILHLREIFVMNEINNRFKIKLYGLSEDMEDFMLERNDFYTQHKTKFWSSFWKTCVDIRTNGIDLSDKQLEIIRREYKIEKREKKKSDKVQVIICDDEIKKINREGEKK